MSRRRPSRWHGLLPVHKRSGLTSHDVVDLARKALGERRIGHTGTLDPLAEGLLILCVGQATRLQKYMLGWDKTYRGVIQLGHATTTYDTEGEVIDPQGVPPALDDRVLRCLERRFADQKMQIPPPFSAKKVGGKRLYELARKGEKVQPEPKSIKVLDVRFSAAASACINLTVTVASGFYVRSLAHDVGLELGCGGHLHYLTRTQIGPLKLENALAQEDFEKVVSPEEIIGGSHWIPINKILLPYPEIEIDRGAMERFLHGQEVVVFQSSMAAPKADDSVVVRGLSGNLLGIGTVQHVLARGRTITIKPRMVFAEEAK